MVRMRVVLAVALMMGMCGLAAKGEEAKMKNVSGDVTKIAEKEMTVVGKVGEAVVSTDVKLDEKTSYLILTVEAGEDGKIKLQLKPCTIGEVQVGSKVTVMMNDEGAAEKVFITPTKK